MKREAQTVPTPPPGGGSPLRTHDLLSFGRFSLDPTAKVLFRDTQPVHLTRKAVETLLVLLEQPGQVLTKEEIIAAVWGDRVVDEANLTQNIAVIRKALGVHRGDPAWIETFPGRGYRIEGPVATATPATIIPASHPEGALEKPVTEPAPHGGASLRWFWIATAIATLAFIAILVKINGPKNPSPSFRVTPVTRMPGMESQPAISRDGLKIAFLWAESGSSPPSVWVQNLGEASARQISKPGQHHSSPVWSAIDSRLAYLRTGRESTEVIVAEPGGPEIVVATLARPLWGLDQRLLDWSPDGKTLVISHSTAQDKPLGLSLISLATGERHSLTQPEIENDVDPRFSPDGSKINFIRRIHRSQQELFSIAVSGGDPVQLTSFGRQISSHDWSPRGDSLLLASDREGEFRVWRRSVDNTASNALVPLGIYAEFPIHLSAARTSDALVYSVRHLDRNIWRLDLRDKSWRRLIASTGQDASPQYSPAGDQISFRSDRSGDEQLWIARPDGSGLVEVTHPPMRPSVGRWSPDGGSLVFNNPRTGEIFVADSGASGWTVRNTGASGVHPVFSPDGHWIYAGGLNEILRIPVKGGTSSPVAKTKSESLAVSHDGRFIYFAREQQGTAVWRAEIATGELTQVLDDLVPGCTSCWALAPAGLYYLGTDKKSFDSQVLYYRDFATGKDRIVTPYPEPLWPMGSGPFSLAPDQRALLTVRVDPSNSDVMMVAPFR